MAGPPEDAGFSVTFQRGQEDAERQIKELCTRLLPGWAGVRLEDMQVSRISGGISNLLVKVAPPPPLTPVAVKVFGDKTELLIDRNAEKTSLLRLNEQGFGAPVVGLFGNGRIEAFLEAVTLTPDDVADPRFLPLIAARLRAFHDLRIPPPPPPAIAAAATAAAAAAGPHAGAGADAGAPTASSSTAAAAGGSDGGGGGGGGDQWDVLYGWLRMAEGLSFDHDPAKAAAFAAVDLVALRAELSQLRALCERVASPRVFCHNDLLPGNILVVLPPPPQEQQQAAQQRPQVPAQQRPQVPAQQRPQVPPQQEQQAPPPPREQQAAPREQQAAGGQRAGGAAQEEAAAGASGRDAHSAGGGAGGADVLRGGALQFIDFEYSGYGPRGFDFGNHFNEYAGFDCDYGRFPTPDQQKAFFRHYLQPGELRSLALARLGSAAAAAAAPAASASGAGGAGGAAVAEAEAAVLDRMVAEACAHALLSHAYWGVWSFVQARYSPIDFDYLDYSALRWREFHRRKAEFAALVERAFPQ